MFSSIAGIRDTVDAALSYAVVFADFESGGRYSFVVVVLVELVQHNGWLEWIAPLMMAAADVVDWTSGGCCECSPEPGTHSRLV